MRVWLAAFFSVKKYCNSSTVAAWVFGHRKSASATRYLSDISVSGSCFFSSKGAGCRAVGLRQGDQKFLAQTRRKARKLCGDQAKPAKLDHDTAKQAKLDHDTATQAKIIKDKPLETMLPVAYARHEWLQILHGMSTDDRHTALKALKVGFVEESDLLYVCNTTCTIHVYLLVSRPYGAGVVSWMTASPSWHGADLCRACGERRQGRQTFMITSIDETMPHDSRR